MITSSIYINGRFICSKPLIILYPHWFCNTSSFSACGFHYNDVKMVAIASKITSLTIVYSTVYNKTWKLRVTGLGVGNSAGTGEFPARMASNAENVSIWWRHHDHTTASLPGLPTLLRNSSLQWGTSPTFTRHSWRHPVLDDTKDTDKIALL